MPGPTTWYEAELTPAAQRSQQLSQLLCEELSSVTLSEYCPEQSSWSRHTSKYVGAKAGAHGGCKGGGGE